MCWFLRNRRFPATPKLKQTWLWSIPHLRVCRKKQIIDPNKMKIILNTKDRENITFIMLEVDNDKTQNSYLIQQSKHP